MSTANGVAGGTVPPAAAPTLPQTEQEARERVTDLSTRYFPGAPVPRIEFDPTICAPECLGEFRIATGAIRLAPVLLEDPLLLQRVAIHELAHLAAHRSGVPSPRLSDGHGAVWRGVMLTIGQLGGDPEMRRDAERYARREHALVRVLGEIADPEKVKTLVSLVEQRQGCPSREGQPLPGSEAVEPALKTFEQTFDLTAQERAAARLFVELSFVGDGPSTSRRPQDPAAASFLDRCKDCGRTIRTWHGVYNDHANGGVLCLNCGTRRIEIRTGLVFVRPTGRPA